MSCQKAQGFLEENELVPLQVLDANKQKQGRDRALALARAVNTVVIAKGKKVVRFDMKKDAPDDDTLAAHLLGPTGNLRAPTIRQGKTLYVGFNPEAYQEMVEKA